MNTKQSDKHNVTNTPECQPTYIRFVRKSHTNHPTKFGRSQRTAGPFLMLAHEKAQRTDMMRHGKICECRVTKEQTNEASLVTRSKNHSLSQNSRVYGRQRSSPTNPIFPTIEHTHTQYMHQHMACYKFLLD